MARFRPFGRRQDGPAAHEPDPWLDDPPPGRPDVGPGVEVRSVEDQRCGDRRFDDRDRDDRDLGDGRLDGRDRWGPGPVAGVPATRAATPAIWAPRRAGPDPVELDDTPVTDPFGFPPVPPVVGTDDDPPVRRVPAWAAWVPDRPSHPDPFPAGPDDPAEGPLRPAGGPAATSGRAVPAQDAPSSAAAVTSTAAARPAADPPGARPSSAPPRPATPSTIPPDAEPSSAEPVFVPQASTAVPPPPTTASRPCGPGDRPVQPSAPDPAEAAALAGAFAADYLSWDEDDPARRGRALADHLPGPDAGHALLGWSGGGRQRAEIVLPGAVRPDGDGRLLVDVRVRVTPYRRVSRSEATPEPDPGDALGTPAAAPPVTARGWRGLAARWVRIGVAVVRDGERLVVDVGEETSDDPGGEPDPAPARPVRTPEDPTIDGDDVVAVNGSRR